MVLKCAIRPYIKEISFSSTLYIDLYIKLRNLGHEIKTNIKNTHNTVVSEM